MAYLAWYCQAYSSASKGNETATLPHNVPPYKSCPARPLRIYEPAVLLQCFVVATLASMTPAEPFIFRNYEYPLSATPLQRKLMAAPGSSSHQVWQAVRSSSAAPYYLDDFKCGSDRCAALPPKSVHVTPPKGHPCFRFAKSNLLIPS
jgi:hypothetical protein